jgi:hypothetical protein
VRLLLTLYLAGVVVGCLRTDAPFPRRLALALLWPVAVIAGIVTVSGLTLLAAVLFPVLGVVLAAAVVAGVWMWGA